MEFNRAQCLVHDDATLAQFRTNHGIPNDILIERSGPNEVVAIVKPVTAIAEAEGEKEGEKGGNLVAFDPILVVNLDDKAPVIPKVRREEVKHSLVGEEEVDLCSDVEMSPKLMKFDDHDELRSMASLQRGKKCFDELKREQKKVTILKGELKKKNEGLIAKRASLDEEHAIFAKVLPLQWRRWPRSEQMHFKRAKSRVLRSSTCPQIILHGQWRSPRLFSQTRLSRIRQSFSRLQQAEYVNLPAEEDESVDGSTEVEDADAAKEIKAEADAARAEGDQQDNPLWCKVSYYM
ncbi:hypothetical protein Acr_24g0004290 [Actinidia rufa]|uniref:Uncharacterized protein n=1 Tax=Actinidia rufa TaxID=165716 RepID=A0A7J0GTT3_9ERIC|nr:hypothetical protein Acr_24g0004290 [Actinidia rufa]